MRTSLGVATLSAYQKTGRKEKAAACHCFGQCFRSCAGADLKVKNLVAGGGLPMYWGARPEVW